MLQAFLSVFAELQSFDCALQTLNHMHLDSNICHLDITPGNIMMQSKPASPWDAVRLIDFGFADWFNEGATRKSHNGLDMLRIALCINPSLTSFSTLACCMPVFCMPCLATAQLLLACFQHDICLRILFMSPSWMGTYNRCVTHPAA